MPPKVSCFSDEKTIALKQQLVAGDYSSAHSCAHCEIFAIPIGSNDGFPERFLEISKTTDEIHQLATNGCIWWSLFNHKLKPEQPGRTETETVKWYEERYSGPIPRENSAVIRMGYMQSDYPLEIKIRITTRQGSWTTYFVPLTQPDKRNYPGSHSLGSPINANPGSETSIQLICSWLKACSVQHFCGIDDLPPSLPTTLLAVGEKRIHLVDTVGLSVDRYIALSYCWGTQEQKTQLKKENKQQLLNDIPYEHLDATIQEAVNITRKIGFRYLWVDALCIVQNSRDQKSHEISRMHEIYRNATLTLIPSRAGGVKEGFLSKRRIAGSASAQRTFKFPYVDEGSIVSGHAVILIPFRDIVANHEPWDERAWTLQEVLMSKRCLEFGTEQTTWNCRHATVQYRDSDGWVPLPFKSFLDSRNDFTRNDASDIIASPSRYDLTDVRSVWGRILRDFSLRRITYQSDRLPAISSIAKQFASTLNDIYICGLWRSTLYGDLLWFRSSRSYPTPKSAHMSDVNPSWSWAACRERIAIPYSTVFKDDDFEVLGYNIQPEPQGDKYGVVTSASLRLRGLITSVPEPILTDRRANLLGISGGDAMPETACYREGRNGNFSESERRQSGLIRRGKGRRGARKRNRITELSNTLVCAGVQIDDRNWLPSRGAGDQYQDRVPSKPRPKLTNMKISLLIAGHQENKKNRLVGPSGLIIAKKKNGAYYRLGRFEVWDVWGLGREHWEGYSHVSEKEYRARLLYLWGGKSSVSEITLE